MQIVSNPNVKAVFDGYPKPIKTKILRLRDLIFKVTENLEELENLEETLKWGEPSYVTKHGSTLRMDWKPKNPNQYALYFQCTTSLVSTFKIIYKDTFKFEGNRAIIFNLDDKIPVKELKHCILLTLTYHKVKHLQLLGA